MLSSSSTLIFNDADEQQGYEILQTSALASTSFESLRHQLQSLLKDGYPCIDRVAEIARTSRRSLQRKLAQDHLSYSLLVEQVRFETAVELLQDPGLSLIDISLELGYANAASFTRAFKRWTGISPSQFRHLHNPI